MSNPLRAPRETVQSVAPSAFLLDFDKTVVNPRHSLEDVVDFYARVMGMKMRNSVYIDPTYMAEPPLNPTAQQTLATAQLGGLQFTNRSKSAFEVNTAMWRTLSSEDGDFTTQGAVRRVMTDRFYVTGATSMTRGRWLKYYRPTHMLSRNALDVPTADEVAHALDASGCVMRGPIAPYVIVRTDPDVPAVLMNRHSDNGYPVGGRGDTPGAMEKVLALVDDITLLLGALPRTVQFGKGDFPPAEGVRKAELVEQEIYRWFEAKPELVLVKGKCKQDYYSAAKIHSRSLRFYNALPRQMVLIMQRATQPFEAQTYSLFENSFLHSAQKVTLVRGGADRLVRALDIQLEEHGVGYAHVGDDSWVALRSGPDLVMCALDCEAFDLTQNSAVTAEIHRQFRNMLAAIDPVAAGVWMAFARRRLLVVEQTVVVEMEHGGPSGMPMQSKVNDVLMEILIARFVRLVMEGNAHAGSAEDYDALMQRVGKRLGLRVKVEQFHRFEGVSTIRQALRVRPFLFVGYYFWASEDNFVYPFTDLPRTMAQMAYPGGKWKASNRLFLRTEAMRLTSIAMGSGLAPPSLRTAQLALFQECSRLLATAINDTDNPDEVDERLVWATQVAPLAMNENTVALFAASLRGLQQAFDDGRGVLKLWRHEDDVVDRLNGERAARIVYTPEAILAMRPFAGVRQREDGMIQHEDPLPGSSDLVRLVSPVAWMDPLLHREVTIFEVVNLRRETRRDISDLVLEEGEAPLQPERKTLGRFPRLKRETPREESARKHRENVARARLRRAAEEEEEAKPQGRRPKKNDGLGSSAAERSRQDLDAMFEKDLRRKHGAGKKKRK